MPPPIAFLLAQQAAAQSSGLEVPLLCAGNHEEPQAQLAVGLVQPGMEKGLSSLFLPPKPSQLRKAGVA